MRRWRRHAAQTGALCFGACLFSRADVRRPQTELRKSVTAWFYEDGELALDVFKTDVLRLLATFERGRAKSE